MRRWRRGFAAALGVVGLWAAGLWAAGVGAVVAPAVARSLVDVAEWTGGAHVCR